MSQKYAWNVLHPTIKYIICCNWTKILRKVSLKKHGRDSLVKREGLSLTYKDKLSAFVMNLSRYAEILQEERLLLDGICHLQVYLKRSNFMHSQETGWDFPVL